MKRTDTPNVSSRREFLQASGVAALLSRQAFAQGKSNTRPPNILIVLSDDQGYGDFSCHGNPVLRTPSLDRLHKESVRFTDFHAAPMCTPTRGQLLTGQDALHNGATSVTAGRTLLRKGIPTMADIFAGNGYATGLFGKWHLGDYYPYRPMDRGFQEAKYFLSFGMSSAHEFDNDYFNGRYRDKGTPLRFAGYCTDFWFNEAMNWMRARQQAREPFLCYLPTNTPHGPAWVENKYSDPYNKPGLPAAFYGMIANLDENLGKLEAFLLETGLRENTIVVFMTDNGGTAGVPVFNSGMRGRKTQYYEGGHRVPCFIRWPAGGLHASGDIAVPAQMQDILPTLMELCGIQKSQVSDFDGASLAGVLKGSKESLPDRMMVVQYGQIPAQWDCCVIWGKWRLVKGTELYDIHSDSGQKTDVASQNPEVVNRMRSHYEAWWRRVEPGLREYAPISIGAVQENPVSLCCADWQDIYCDNPRSVLSGAGGPQGGPWNVLVERDGDYEIELRRWPAAIDLPLNASCPERKMTAGVLQAGIGLPIARAQLRVAGQQQSVATSAADKAATFRVNLKRGPKTQLHGWFQDTEGKDLCGAYYAYVRRI